MQLETISQLFHVQIKRLYAAHGTQVIAVSFMLFQRNDFPLSQLKAATERCRPSYGSTSSAQCAPAFPPPTADLSPEVDPVQAFHPKRWTFFCFSLAATVLKQARQKQPGYKDDDSKGKYDYKNLGHFAQNAGRARRDWFRFRKDLPQPFPELRPQTGDCALLFCFARILRPLQNLSEFYRAAPCLDLQLLAQFL